MLKDVEMTMLKSTQKQDAVYVGNTSDDGMRNKKQHEGKDKGWACNNHNMRNPSLHLFYGVTKKKKEKKKRKKMMMMNFQKCGLVSHCSCVHVLYVL